MEISSNIYRYNLEILSNLQENQNIYYEQNKIFVDDRYFGRYRYGNNPNKIVDIIKFSFLHYYNQLLLNLLNKDDFNEILELLRKTITGIKLLIKEENESLSVEEKIIFENLRNNLVNLLTELNNKDDESLNTNVNYETEEESDSENCLKSMLHSTEQHLRMNDNNIIVNTIYVVKNQVTRIIFEIGNIIYNIVNF